MNPPRSWLFAPGYSHKLLSKVFDAGADAVILDLEDSVPEAMKDGARGLVAEVANVRRCWVRVNRPRTEACERDLEMLAESVIGFRIPKVEAVDEVAWVAARAPGVPLDCTIESAVGVGAVNDIARYPKCTMLSLGTIDLANDLGSQGGQFDMLFARSLIVLASRGAGKPAPSDGVFANLGDDDGLRDEAEGACRLGFSGKSAIHPRQVKIINDAFAPSKERLEWARQVLEAFKESGGAATRLPNGQFVDLPVAERASAILRSEHQLEPSRPDP